MSPSKSTHRDYHSSSDKRDGNHADSRNMFSDQKKDIQRHSESSDRGPLVVKTCSVHTSALPTVVYRLVRILMFLVNHNISVFSGLSKKNGG